MTFPSALIKVGLSYGIHQSLLRGFDARMNDHRKAVPSWFEIIVSAMPVGMLAVVLVMVATIVIIVFLDYRIEEVEGRLLDVPPSAYEAPVLENYSVGDVDVTSLPVRQLVYVPVYSHVYFQGGAPFPLETTLSIRNTDPDQAVFLSSVQYFDTSGKLTRTYLDQSIRLAPLQTIEFLVERRDSSGGSGANFLVEWLSDHDGEKPLIEAVMVGSMGYQAFGISRSGVEIAQPGNGQSDQQP